MRSLTKSSDYSELTGKKLVFWKSDRLKEVVRVEVQLYNVFLRLCCFSTDLLKRGRQASLQRRSNGYKQCDRGRFGTSPLQSTARQNAGAKQPGAERRQARTALGTRVMSYLCRCGISLRYNAQRLDKQPRKRFWTNLVPNFHRVTRLCFARC